MKKRFLAVCLCMLLMTGCAAWQEETPAGPEGEPAAEDSASEPLTVQEEQSAPEVEDLFSSLPETFMFASGAGAWSTEISIGEDGAFSGLYHDADMGDAGEDYPEGTVYTCVFSGKFSQPEQLDGDTYSVRLESLKTEDAPEVFYGDGRRYIASTPYGLEDADEILIYFPGKKTADLPEEFHAGWAEFSREEAELPFYALYNVNEQAAFIAYPAKGET